MSGPQEPGGALPEDLAAVLGALTRAAKRIALYSDEHPLSHDALHGALDALRPLWDAAGDVTLSFEDDTLRLNGLEAPRMPLTDTFAQQLKRLHIVAIILEPSVTADALATLLRVLNAQPAAVFDQGGPEAALAEVPGVRIETVSFRRFQTESDSLQLQLLLKEQASSAGIQRVVTTCARYLTEYFTNDEASEYSFEPSGLLAGDTAAHRNDLGTVLAMIVQRAGEGASRRRQQDRWLGQMLGAMAQLPTSVLANCFRAPQVNTQDAPDFLALIGSQVPLELAVSAVCHEPQQVPAERSDRLRRALVRLAGDGERTVQLYRQIVERLTAAGLAADAIEMSVGLLMKSQFSADRVRNQLVAMGPMQVERAHREATVFGQLRDQWNATETLDASRRTMLLELLHTDFQLSHYTEVLQLLTEECRRCANGKAGSAVVEVLQALVEERDCHAEGTGHRLVAERAALDALTPTGMEALFELIKTDPIVEVTDLLARTGEGGVTVLARVLEQDLPRPEVAAALASAGQAGAGRLREVVPHLSAGTVHALIQAAAGLRGEPLRRLLAALFDHADSAVRTAILDWAARHGDREVSESLVLRGLDDTERAVQRAAVAAAAATRCASAGPSLLRLQGDARGDDFAQALRDALLVVATPEVVAGLRKWLSERGGWLRWGIERRRAIAAELLLAMDTDAAREALRPFRADRNRAVRQIALMVPAEATG